MWKWKGFTGNTLIQNDGCKLFLNEVELEDEIMEEIFKNSSLQTQEGKFQKMMKKKLIGFWDYCIFKGKSEVYIIGMPCAGLFLCE